MAINQFLNPSIKWVPQPGFSVVYTENGGIEASQDILIRNTDLSTVTVFNRGTRWEAIFPEVPRIYRFLSMKTFDPTDRGDGFSILKCTFTGYQFVGPESSGLGNEIVQATSTLTGQLTSEPLSSHPKWQPLSDEEKVSLGNLMSGEWVYIQDPFNAGTFALAVNQGNGKYSILPNEDQVTSEDGLMFLKIIAEGDQTWDRGGWTYSYHTESEEGFTPAQLNSLGKIVANPPGNPQDPGDGWTWMLASPSQSQSGLDRFIKTLDFRLIQDNAKNQFLYDY
jgi:hypothetical protein